MITIISGSNRKNSGCLTFARKYKEILEEQTEEPVKLLALETIPHDWFHPEMYSSSGQSKSLRDIQDTYLLPADKFIFFLPEYNGGFPGAVKLLIDACSVRKYRATFHGKKAGLVGIASGRAGNLRGLDHFCAILHHVGTLVMPNKLPISRIEELTDSMKEVIDEETLLVMQAHAKEVVDF